MGDMPTVNGHINGTLKSGFTVKDVPVENLRPLRVVVVGAGFSGILAAIRIPERLRNVELVVYEKNEAVGGVWYVLPVVIISKSR
jgi:ribulose 1,5-bisphosphate synthetase/thiazole synthase